MCIRSNLQLRYQNSHSGTGRRGRLAPPPLNGRKSHRPGAGFVHFKCTHSQEAEQAPALPTSVLLLGKYTGWIVRKGYVGTAGTTLHRCSFRKRVMWRHPERCPARHPGHAGVKALHGSPHCPSPLSRCAHKLKTDKTCHCCLIRAHCQGGRIGAVTDTQRKLPVKVVHLPDRLL